MTCDLIQQNSKATKNKFQIQGLDIVEKPECDKDRERTEAGSEGAESSFMESRFCF